MSNSSSLGFGNRNNNLFSMSFDNSNYRILENIKSGIGEWNSVIGSSMSNSLIVGYNSSDESREPRGTLFPMVDILGGDNTTYMAFGSEPFTPNNELRYNSFQLQNNFTKFTSKHTMTFGGTFERYESENVFFPGSQSVYVYNTLDDFLHRRERLPGEPEPDDVDASTCAGSRCATTTSPGRRSRFSRSKCSTAAPTPRTSGACPTT